MSDLNNLTTNISKENWESFGGSHGCWRFCTTTPALGQLSVLIHSTSDRSNPTAKQQAAFSTITNLAKGKYDEMIALIAERYDEDAAGLECKFDLAEVPLIDEAAAAYFYLECDAPDDEHRLTILLRNTEVLGVVDRDAASEISEWDAIDQIEALVWDVGIIDDTDDD